MNVLMVGIDSGAWQIRGHQLGAALGARVTTAPTAEDWHWADLVVLVKRAGVKWARTATRYHVPIVWDALDFWRQPAENCAGETRAFELLIAQISAITPALVISATRAQASGGMGVYLPHHSWAGLTATPARERVSVVGYEGNALYLGAWRAKLEQACAKRGWTFVINPPDLRAVDILVALRDGIWDGWMCRQWKSGVKYVNAIAAGRPVITQDTAAFRELRPVGTAIAVDLGDALDRWSPLEARALAVSQPIAASLTLDRVAAQYVGLLTQVRATCLA